MDVHRLTLDIDGHDVHPSGWLHGDDLPPRRFEGYVQLIGALEEFRGAMARAAGHETETESTDAPYTA
ncbi:MAG TPA: hypothetical protein VNC61_00240 [Acidimicrobiales bacterium]|nr:hypothetical protein [Acidimicrobiales bacterium]